MGYPAQTWGSSPHQRARSCHRHGAPWTQSSVAAPRVEAPTAPPATIRHPLCR
jgi:hypothetical protein